MADAKWFTSDPVPLGDVTAMLADRVAAEAPPQALAGDMPIGEFPTRLRVCLTFAEEEYATGEGRSAMRHVYMAAHYAIGCLAAHGGHLVNAWLAGNLDGVIRGHGR
jgi:hypothetical protein